MTNAILIDGRHKTSEEATQNLKEYLTRWPQIENIHTIRDGFQDAQDNLVWLIKILKENAGKTDLLFIAYFGHGSSYGWNILPYFKLANLLCGYPGKIVIVNDCCLAYSIVSPLESSGLNHSSVSVIASCGANETVSKTILHDMLIDWLNFRPFKPRDKTIRFKLKLKPIEPKAIVTGKKSTDIDKSVFEEKNSSDNYDFLVSGGGERWGPELDFLFYPKLR